MWQPEFKGWLCRWSCKSIQPSWPGWIVGRWNVFLHKRKGVSIFVVWISASCIDLFFRKAFRVQIIPSRNNVNKAIKSWSSNLIAPYIGHRDQVFKIYDTQNKSSDLDKWLGSRSWMNHGSKINEERRTRKRIMDQGLIKKVELGEESWIKD